MERTRSVTSNDERALRGKRNRSSRISKSASSHRSSPRLDLTGLNAELPLTLRGHQEPAPKESAEHEQALRSAQSESAHARRKKRGFLAPTGSRIGLVTVTYRASSTSKWPGGRRRILWSSRSSARLTHLARAGYTERRRSDDVSSAGDDGHMEFRIAAEELKRALYRAQGIVERKTTMPILSNVLVNATKSGVQITAFDLDVGIVSEHPAEVTKPGSLTLSAKTVFDIVQNLPEPHLTVRKLPNQYAELQSGNAHFKIVGMSPEEYPKLPKEESAHLIKLSGPVLLEMIRKTAFAISTDETRYILNGVFFEPREGGKVRMVATDGHRLALVER